MAPKTEEVIFQLFLKMNVIERSIKIAVFGWNIFFTMPKLDIHDIYIITNVKKKKKI